MASVNKVIVIGSLGRDPEIRYTPSGAAVCNVSVATSRKWKNKEGEKQEETEWHRCVAYDKLAEIMGQYLKKGASVYIEGRLKTRKWDDKDGKTNYSTEIIAEQMQMLGAKGDGAGQAERPRSAPSANAEKTGGGTSFDDMDDDIPFVSSCVSHDVVAPLTRRMRRYA
jgi:single-strand DNA-binding protein